MCIRDRPGAARGRSLRASLGHQDPPRKTARRHCLSLKARPIPARPRSRCNCCRGAAPSAATEPSSATDCGASRRTTHNAPRSGFAAGDALPAERRLRFCPSGRLLTATTASIAGSRPGTKCAPTSTSDGNRPHLTAKIPPVCRILAPCVNGPAAGWLVSGSAQRSACADSFPGSFLSHPPSLPGIGRPPAVFCR